MRTFCRAGDVSATERGIASSTTIWSLSCPAARNHRVRFEGALAGVSRPRRVRNASRDGRREPSRARQVVATTSRSRENALLKQFRRRHRSSWVLFVDEGCFVVALSRPALSRQRVTKGVIIASPATLSGSPADGHVLWAAPETVAESAREVAKIGSELYGSVSESSARQFRRRSGRALDSRFDTYKRLLARSKRACP